MAAPNYHPAPSWELPVTCHALPGHGREIQKRKADMPAAAFYDNGNLEIHHSYGHNHGHGHGHGHDSDHVVSPSKRRRCAGPVFDFAGSTPCPDGAMHLDHDGVSGDEHRHHFQGMTGGDEHRHHIQDIMDSFDGEFLHHQQQLHSGSLEVDTVACNEMDTGCDTLEVRAVGNPWQPGVSSFRSRYSVYADNM